MPGRIDPDTGNLVDIDGADPRTYAEIQQIKPPCPRCGTLVSVIPFLVDSKEGAGPMNLYQFGRHRFNCGCWNG